MAKPNRQKINYKCEAVKTDDKAKLYLYGNISQKNLMDPDVISALGVKEMLEAIGEVESIDVHINSNGGDVFEAITIYNLLKQHPARINIYVDGLAASGASIIAMAGNDITMYKVSMMMIHKAWTFAVGNAEELRKIAQAMDKMDSAVLQAYKDKFTGPEKELKDLISKETWLTAQECMDYGFCTILLEETEDPKKLKEVGQVKNRILNKIRAQSAKEQNILNKFNK